MRITLSVLLATLTIYCNSSVLSLPPSLIATAASSQQHHDASQIRDKRGAVAAASNAGTDHLLKQLNVRTDPPPPPPLHNRETVRSKKEARFRLNGENIATIGYNNKNADTNSDDITRQPSYELNSNAEFQMLHPNEVNSILVAAAKDAHERYAAGSVDEDHLNEITTEFKRKLPSENDLNALLANAAADRLGSVQLTRPQQQPPTMRAIDATPQLHAMLMKKFFTPLKYWTHHCQPPDRDCWQEYYRKMHIDRNNAAAAATKQMNDFTKGALAVNSDEDGNDTDDDDVNMKAHAFAFGGDHYGDGGGGGVPIGKFNDDAAIDSVYNNADIGNINRVGDGGNDNEDNNAGNDILMLLSGEEDVMKFLSWAMSHLYPYKHFANLSGESAEYYHPGMYNWKKLNLSGRLEPPILVEEPHYVIVRREQLEEDMKPSDTQYKGDPFIPPRGRKHHLPDLDALLNRYETFVPNRGKRDKIKDIFKYDDLFFPNRGKKQKPSKPITISAYRSVERQRSCDQETGAVCSSDAYGVDERIENRVDESDDNELTAQPTSDAMRRIFSALKKRLQAHTPYMSWLRSNAERSNKGETSLGINLNRNSDDNLSSNYADTIDSNAVAIGASKSYDDKGDGDVDNAAFWLPDIDDSAIMLTSSPTNERDQSVKSSIPQIIGAIDTLNDVPITMMAARMRRMPSTYGGALRVAANRLRSTTTMSARQRQQKQRAALQQLLYNQQELAKQQKLNEAEKSAGMLRYLNRYMKRAPSQAQRRANALLSMTSNQVRDRGSDLFDLLPLRQLQEIKTHQQQKDFDKKSLTVAHLPLSWFQHMSMPQPHLRPQQQSFGGIDGVAVGRNPPETANIGSI